MNSSSSEEKVDVFQIFSSTNTTCPVVTQKSTIVALELVHIPEEVFRERSFDELESRRSQRLLL